MTPGRKAVVTKELVLKIYEYKQKFGDKISNMELSKLVGVSDSTVGRVFKGEYDYLLKDESKNKEDSSEPDIGKKLDNLSEQLFKMNNGIQFDHTELGDLLEDIKKELVSIGDLLHIIAVYHMRNEKDRPTKVKMADQIQACHTNKRLSEALKK